MRSVHVRVRFALANRQVSIRHIIILHALRISTPCRRTTTIDNKPPHGVFTLDRRLDCTDAGHLYNNVLTTRNYYCNV